MFWSVSKLHMRIARFGGTRANNARPAEIELRYLLYNSPMVSGVVLCSEYSLYRSQKISKESRTKEASE